MSYIINEFKVNDVSASLYSDNSVKEDRSYIYQILDSSSNVLFGIKKDGETIIPKGIPTQQKRVNEQVDSSLDTLSVSISDVDTRLSDSVDFINSSITDIQETMKSYGVEQEQNYLEMKLDSSGNVMSYRRTDGTHVEPKFESSHASIRNLSLTGTLEVTDSIREQFSQTTDVHVTERDDLSYLEMTMDTSGNILSYRKSDGTLHEAKMHINALETGAAEAQKLTVNNELNLGTGAMSSMSEIIRSMNIQGGTGDWTDYMSVDGDYPLFIPTPKCAKINISGISNMPTSKTANYQAWFECWDMTGNYFKKPIIINAQGNSSMGNPKKNFSIDLFDSEWDGDAFKIQIGNWVPQDSFHFKAYYCDHFRCVCPVSYKIFEQVTKTRSLVDDRTWKRALLPSNEEIGYYSNTWEESNDDLALDSGARCVPDGFPCIVYLNGEFYGVFAWQLKKHRDNYQMKKSKSKHIHLDGNISAILLWTANGTINWDKWNKKVVESDTINNRDGLEIRNPKDLVGIDGSEYDHDTNAVELIDSTYELYDPENEDHVMTAEVKQYLIDATTILSKIDEAIAGGQSDEEIRAVIETYFDVTSLIDYLVFSDFIRNYDGFKKNWQWTTWDGVKWAVNPYDLDGVMGWSSWGVTDPSSERLGNTEGYPTYYIIKYYTEELEARYKELRDCGIFTTKNVIRIFEEWIGSVGTVYYQMEHDMWPYDEEHYSAASGVHVDNLYRVANWMDLRIAKCDEIYNYTT